MSIDGIVAMLEQIQQTVSDFFKTELWKSIEGIIALAFGVVVALSIWVIRITGVKEKAKKAKEAAEKERPSQGDS